MYIIAIGWMWVVLMMSITQKTILAGVSTLVFYGILPCALLMYILMTPARRRRQARREAEAEAQAKATAEGNAAANPPAEAGTQPPPGN